VELHVAKQRNGPKASLQLDHRSELYTFEEASVSW
jgi:replicative DNA helicase